MNLPRFIAICGAPGAGKSEVQKILERLYGVLPGDDGWCLRDFAIRHLGADQADVCTQHGKARVATMPGGKVMTWRKLLGEFGNAIEALLGDDAIPEIAIAQYLDQSQPVSFASVRRLQGRVYQRYGGIVIGVRSRRAGVGSSHEFDGFDPAAVDYWVENDGALDELEAAVAELIARIAADRQRTVAEAA